MAVGFDIIKSYLIPLTWEKEMEREALTKENILEFLRENKDFFKKEFDVDRIMLFGSYARDEATKESDVDILIESEIKSFDKQFRLKLFLEKSFNRKVDLAYRDAVRKFVMRFIEGEIIYA